MTGRPSGHGAERRVTGLHPVRELLRSDHVVYRIDVAGTRGTSPVLAEIRTLAAERGVPVAETSHGDLEILAGDAAHQGVVATAPPFPYVDLDELPAGAGPALLVALDGVTDPHNVGAIARTAEAVGAGALLVPARRSAPVTAVAEKAAAGALAYLPVARVTNLARALQDLGRRGVWSVGLDGDVPLVIYDCDLLTQPVVLVIGAEGRGLSRLTRDRCDALVRLPMRGRIGSLNASVAAAVALYETIRARSHVQ